MIGRRALLARGTTNHKNSIYIVVNFPHRMKIIIISDTHGHHRKLNLPAGDVLVHCGDVCGQTTEESVRDFALWFDQLPYKHKLCIAGNHDKHMNASWFKKSVYLQDDGVEINGCYFYGSPWTPTFFDWYWMKDRGSDIAERWSLIPEHTDVLITHGPPSNVGTLSTTVRGADVGCSDLQKAIERVKPTLNCFGHIHEGYGISRAAGVDYINASTCTLDYQPINPPVQYEIW